MAENARTVVIPGEIIAEGDDYFAGEGTEKIGPKVYARRYGLREESNNLIKVIPLSGTYIPRRGNIVLGKVVNMTFNGWVIDIGGADRAFLSIMEVPKYVNKDHLEEVLDMGDLVMAKIWAVNRRGIDLSLKSRGLGRVDEGIVFKVNPHKVPRIIGKEGSMIKIIKDETNTHISVGQNGYVWIKGASVSEELFAKKAIMYVAERSYMSGLTDEVMKWFSEQKEGKK